MPPQNEKATPAHSQRRSLPTYPAPTTQTFLTASLPRSSNSPSLACGSCANFRSSKSEGRNRGLELGVVGAVEQDLLPSDDEEKTSIWISSHMTRVNLYRSHSMRRRIEKQEGSKAAQLPRTGSRKKEDVPRSSPIPRASTIPEITLALHPPLLVEVHHLVVAVVSQSRDRLWPTRWTARCDWPPSQPPAHRLPTARHGTCPGGLLYFVPRRA